MLGVWLCIIFVQMAGLTLAVWAYYDLKEQHECDIQDHVRHHEELELRWATKYVALKAELVDSKQEYEALETGFDEMEVGYQQEILDFQDQLSAKTAQVSYLTAENAEIEKKYSQQLRDGTALINKQTKIIADTRAVVAGFKRDLANHVKICPAFSPDASKKYMP